MGKNVFLLAHPLSTSALAAAAVVVLLALILRAATGARPKATHRGRGHAATPRTYAPRHPRTRFRREADVRRGPVQLGQRPDGDITLVHAPAAPVDYDGPTVERPALIGAAA